MVKKCVPPVEIPACSLKCPSVISDKIPNMPNIPPSVKQKCERLRNVQYVMTGNLTYLPLFLVQLCLILFFMMAADYDEGRQGVTRGLEDIHVMVFVGFGFLMTFFKRYYFSALGLGLLLAALFVQWGIMCQQYSSSLFGEKDWIVSLNRKALLDGAILAITVLISLGVIIGFSSVPQLMFIGLMEIVMICMYLHMFHDLFKAVDIGGGLRVHAFGAYFGLGMSTAMQGQRPVFSSGSTEPDSVVRNRASYASNIFAMFGTLLLWVCWPSFNAALAVSMNGFNRCITNTYLSMAACTVMTFILSAYLNDSTGKFDMLHVQNSTLAGGVIVSSVSNMYIYPGGAMLLGVIAACISVNGFKFLTPFLKHAGIRDTCGIHNVHGMPGLFSGLLSIFMSFFATYELYGPELVAIFPTVNVAKNLSIMFQPLAYNDFFIEPALLSHYYEYTTPIYEYELGNRTPAEQAIFQFAAVIMTVVVAVFTGIATGILAAMLWPLEQSELYSDDPTWVMPDS